MNNESRRNPKYYNNISVPDTDSRGIELNRQGLNVTPNLNYDHTRLQYTAPVNNTQPVSINTFLNGDERSLHTFILNNSANSTSKNFIFSPSYVFLDDAVVSNTKTVDAGKTAVYYGCIILGKMYFRVSVESTN
jgi:hypothetical protein